MLSQLPLELVDAIADLLPQRSVWSLSLVSTILYAALFPRLHRAITFRASNEWALNILDVGLFLGDCPDYRAGEILHYTRQLTVKAPIRIARFHRCVYNSNFFPPATSPRGLTLGSPHEPTAHSGFLESLSSQIHQVFPRLEPGILHSFQWHIGTCIPANVLDAQGHLVHHQKQIRRLSLITNGTCPHAGQHLEGLSCFTALSELEWEGALYLIPVGGESTKPLWLCGYRGLFPSSFRDDHTRPDLDGYSLLTSLTLSRVSFPSALLPGVQRSPFRALQALTLRDCPSELHFLQLLARSSRPVSLRYFEISSDCLRESGERLAFIAIVEFLLSFRGLQYLYLKISNFPQFLPGLDDAIHHHQSALRGLIFHERRLMAVDREQIFEELRDDVTVTLASIPRILRKICSPIALGLCLRPASTESSRQPTNTFVYSDPPPAIQWGGKNPLRPPAGDPFAAAERYGPMAPVASLKIQEVEGRRTRLLANAKGVGTSGVRQAGQWAFGPAGLPALQILAFGDFSHGDRYREQQVLIQRKRPDRSSNGTSHRECYTANRAFCLADIDNDSFWDDLPLDGLNGPRFLSACPSTGLMESPYDL
ncbi:hypothetical protein ASPCAL14846 [Aspergillus calidoustus]|uniref:F-box domain-containing protein n=1 Tax=Aspergillus calidoustus TaxID=454130 RepID=A0A0U4ZQX1_ASPCI|nr:hypothetical protein ASPCAL14846 [Aspergillus calidoustus]